MLSSGLDILDPINAGGGGTAMFMLSAKYFQGKNNATPADGTAVGSAGNVPTDLYGVNTFSQATAANRPLFKTTEGFKTIQCVDNTDNIATINTLSNSATSILYGFFGKINSHNSGTASNNQLLFIQNTLGTGFRFAVSVNETNIYFATNNNDVNSSGQNNLNITEQTDLKNTYMTLLCYQNFIDNTKWIYVNNRLIGSTTTSFGAGIPAANSISSTALGQNTLSPPNHCKVAFMVKNFASNPTTEDIRRINNYLIHN
jgi:hypothetical protein